MELLLQRNICSSKSTIGKLLIDGVPFCYTLEDVVRDINHNGKFDNDEAKVHGKTAILSGRYKVVLTVSNRFKKLMPLLLDTPNFMGIRIHSGNIPEDTEGCILIGNTKSADFIGNSRDAFNALMVNLQEAIKTEELFITIKDITS